MAGSPLCDATWGMHSINRMAEMARDGDGACEHVPWSNGGTAPRVFPRCRTLVDRDGQRGGRRLQRVLS